MTITMNELIVYTIGIIIMTSAVVYNIFFMKNIDKPTPNIKKTDDFFGTYNTDDIPVKEALQYTNFVFDKKKQEFIRTLAFIGMFLDSNDKLEIDDNIHITKELINSYNQYIKYNIYYKNDYIGEATTHGVLLTPLIEYVDDGSNTFPNQTIDSEFDYKTIEQKLFMLILSKHDELKQQHAIKHNLLNAAQRDIYVELLNRFS